MPGTNAGTGCPLHFRCAKCRKAHGTNEYFGQSSTSGLGRVDRVVLTGKMRGPYDTRNSRQSMMARQYKCLDCGHVGWSRHVRLERA